ncbi:hypothetical protein Cgig2_013734 [Carnegiea gigantea]|uniref:Uncharacterized protein n=1 Tax=Carnegiea gigantea TaxID=171969 RepID=A0A9Q1Q7U7_9CARY|nr:hypothetical protein Cgig2_013734 [Carnegiea gigantea]
MANDHKPEDTLFYLYCPLLLYWASNHTVAFETHNYDPLDEVQKTCSLITTNAVNVKLPIMKLIGLRMSCLFIMGSGSNKEIMTDVSSAHQSKRTMGVNGYLILGITFDLLPAMPSDRQAPQFSMWEGNTQLFVSLLHSKHSLLKISKSNNAELGLQNHMKFSLGPD